MKKDLHQILSHYQKELNNSSAEVKLISYTSSHANLSAATARTCYSQKGLVLPQQMQKDEKTVQTRDRILLSTLKAGHLTTRQHSHYVFTLNNISRNIIWDFFHSHPYYNSEQVSQRYTYIDNSQDWYYLPQLSHSLTQEYHRLHQQAHHAYLQLREILLEPIHEQLKQIHRIKAKQKPKMLLQMAQRKSAEFARYVLPVSTYARMYHSINALTLLRYYHAIGSYAHKEVDVVILKMIQEVLKVDSSFALDLQKRELAENPMVSAAQAQQRLSVHKTLDKQISLPNEYTALLSYPQTDSLKNQLLLQGVDLSNSGEENLWQFLLSNKLNSAISQTINRSGQESLFRNLNIFHFSFYQKISHTADSQEQRHRTLPGTRLSLAMQASFLKEYIVPTVIQEHDQALQYYHSYMISLFESLQKMIEQQPQSIAFASYLLPNAYPTRSYVAGDLLNFYHKWKTRLCFNAQQEIFDLALEQVRLVKNAMPELSEFLGAPCHTRKNTRPICPEGPHYCGVPVWKKSLDELERTI